MAVAVEDNAVTDEEEDFDEEELVVGCSTRFHSSGVTCEVARYHAYDVVLEPVVRKSPTLELGKTRCFAVSQ